jgi:hypothetical protein
VDHIFWGVVSIGILAVLLSLLLKMLIEDFPASSSSGRRRPKLKSSTAAASADPSRMRVSGGSGS